MPEERPEADGSPAPFVPWRRGATPERRRSYRRLAVFYLWSALLFGAVALVLLDGITRALILGLAVAEIVALSVPVLLINRER